jgi:hypothetical protein
MTYQHLAAEPGRRCSGGAIDVVDETAARDDEGRALQTGSVSCVGAVRERWVEEDSGARIGDVHAEMPEHLATLTANTR